MIVQLQTAASNPLQKVPRRLLWLARGVQRPATVRGRPFFGQILCNLDTFASVRADFLAMKSAGGRVWVEAAGDPAAVGDVVNFEWDQRLGILCAIQWTRKGEAMIRDGLYTAFNPIFALVNGVIAGLLLGAPAAEISNQSDFGSALIAASQFEADGEPDADYIAAQIRDNHVDMF